MTMKRPEVRPPPHLITKDCPTCGGDGTVEVHCLRCGEELDTDSWEQGQEYICKMCLAVKSTEEKTNA